MTTTVAVRERPILFSAPMIRAILAGTKAVTRRAVKPQPDAKFPVAWRGSDGRWRWTTRRDFPALEVDAGSVACPFGEPGDRLWVREAWWSDWREPGVAIYDATPEWGKYRGEAKPVRATHPDDTLTTRDESRQAMLPKFWSKRPSIFMPRWASRITLEVLDVKVERLNSITEEDAIAEGVDAVSMADVPRQAAWSRRQDFAALWDKINGKRPGCDWKSNCWVWAISFRRFEPAATEV